MIVAGFCLAPTIASESDKREHSTHNPQRSFIRTYRNRIIAWSEWVSAYSVYTTRNGNASDINIWLGHFRFQFRFIIFPFFINTTNTIEWQRSHYVMVNNGFFFSRDFGSFVSLIQHSYWLFTNSSRELVLLIQARLTISHTQRTYVNLLFLFLFNDYSRTRTKTHRTGFFIMKFVTYFSF